MSISLIPEEIRAKYEVHEWGHACAILKEDFPEEWNEIMHVLGNFKLYASDILRPGGRKSPISDKLDSVFYGLDWTEKQFKTSVIIDQIPFETPTHKVDCFKNEIGIEIEWNNKDPFYDRDLNNFRLLFEYQAISVGVIITRSDSLQDIFNELGKGSSYGASTTHMSKLMPRIEGRSGGGCPLLVFGIGNALYEDDR
jgi:Restriction endonuclease BglII.